MDKDTHTAMIFGPAIQRDVKSAILQRFKNLPLQDDDPKEECLKSSRLVEADIKDMLQLKGIMNPVVHAVAIYRPQGRYAVRVIAHVNGFDSVKFEVPLGAKVGAAA